MNFELFIAKRIISRESGKKSGIRSLVNISVVGIALSLAVMILAVAILTGFKREIKEKIAGFSAHVQVSSLVQNNSDESNPIDITEKFTSEILNLKGVTHAYPFASKPSLLKAGKDIQGVVLRGIDTSFRWDFFRQYLIRGNLPDVGNPRSLEILISQTLANLLKIDTGNQIYAYFVQEPLRMRPLRVCGIYKTGLEEYDQKFVYCHLNLIRSVNDWEDNSIGGLGIILKNPDSMEESAEEIRRIIGTTLHESDEILDVLTIREIAPGFFDFLRLTDMNVWFILALMIMVASFNMISGLLILILDRTRMIGTLRALGASVKNLRKVFLYQAGFIILKGMIIGNLVGLSLAVIQDITGWIPLDPESYFVDAVPIFLHPSHFILLNIGTLIITLIMLLIPSGIISKLSPDKTIKFD